jgi:hypothetical protein
MSIILAIMAQGPVLDFDWLERRARVQGEWQRCVYGRVQDFDHSEGSVDEVVGLAMLTCGEHARNFAAEVRGAIRDGKEAAVIVAHADNGIRREARYWVLRLREIEGEPF